MDALTTKVQNTIDQFLRYQVNLDNTIMSITSIKFIGNIKRINELRDNHNAVSEEVNELINDQVKLVKIKMKELRHLKTQFEAIIDSCSNNQKVGDCGII